MIGSLKVVRSMRITPAKNIIYSRHAIILGERCNGMQFTACLSSQFSTSSRYYAPSSGRDVGKVEAYLQDNYPRIHYYYRLVTNGSKSSFADLKTYYAIRRDLYKEKIALTDLNADELGAYILTREDMLKAVIIAAIIPWPMAFPILVSLIVLFPRVVLTRHFWSEDQRKHYWSLSIASLSKRNFPAIINALKAKNPDLMKKIRDLSEIETPSVSKSNLLPWYHLTRIHGAFLISSSNTLKNRARALQHLDYLIEQRYGQDNLNELSGTELHKQLFLRKIYYSDLTTEEKMREKLLKWLAISKSINDESLYLHLPAIFHYLDSPQENVKSNDATHEKHETIKQSKEDETGNRNLSDQSSGDKKEASALS
ncbi:LETM1-like protein domain-containing protein [Ditylenchus destructor]|uniref:LETM1-like protein domain-containing protein n=1 Tax=Ditylenchus destructor TaxID=166010 RepID=A0AAD4NA64_9BILA|nr:LETM1-like protein domain-containing protein [Ditylenchus destructor]